MDNKTKGILIDIIILFIYGWFLFAFLQFGYGHIFHTRLGAIIIIILNIPICWGTLLMSFMGKKTIGHRIENKNKYIIILGIIAIIPTITVILLTIYSYKHVEDNYSSYEHYDLTDENAYIYTFHHDDGKRTYAISDITPAEYETYREGIFYQVKEDDYILIEKFDTPVRTIKEGNHLTYSQVNYFYTNKKLEDKLITLRPFNYVVEYTLAKEKIEKKELIFDYKNIEKYISFSRIEKIDDEYIYFIAFNKANEEINIKCSLKDYICLKWKE